MGILNKLNNEIKLCEKTLIEIETIENNTLKNNEYRRADWNLFIRILNGIKKDLT